MDNESFAFNASCKVENSLFFSSIIFNGLIKFDLINRKFEYLSSFTNCDEKMQGIHNRAIRHNNSIFFIPDRAKGIHIFDIESKKIDYINLGLQESEKYRGIDSVDYGENIIIIPAYKNSSFFIFNKNNYEVKETDILEKYLPNELKKRDNQIFWSNFVKLKDKIIGCVWDSSYLAIVDLNTRDINFVSVNDENLRFCGIAFDGIRFYITSLGTKDIISISKEYDDYIIIKNEGLKMDNPKDEMVYTGIVSVKDNIFLIPNYDKTIYVLKNKKIEKNIDFPKDFFDFDNLNRKGWRRFFSYDVVDNKLIMYPSRASHMIILDVDTMMMVGECIDIPTEWLKKEYIDYIIKPGIKRRLIEGPMIETKAWNITDMIKYII